MSEPTWYEFSLSELRTWPDFPTDPTVIIIPGGGGHEQEITATFGINYDAWENHIPEYLHEFVEKLCPEGWRIDNRGSRLEFHPSGCHYGGWCEDDVRAVVRAMEELGLKPEVRR